ncbi:MAG: nascent polypeptide-associated complex protein [Candidatus Micrarchaeia archaeon]
MFPTDPRQMQQMLRQMGIKSRMIEAKRVIIECDGSNIIIDNPQVMEMDIKGEKNYSISGRVHSDLQLSEEDIKLVMDGANVSREEAIKALEKEGDVASAIISLKGDK